MLNLARWCSSHRRLVVVGWVVVFVFALGLSGAVGTNYGNSFSLPGTDSQRAADLLSSGFPAQAGDADQIVFHSTAGGLTAPATRERVEATLAKVARLPHVDSVVGPYAGGSHAISRDGTIGFATVNFDERANVLPVSAVERVISTARGGASPTLQIELNGQAIEQAINRSIGYTFVVGIFAAIVVLLISFGSLLAMGLPIATALLGLGTGFGLIGLLSQVMSMPDFAGELALMIGLGVGVDYSLFILTRFREAYRRNGGSVAAAVEEAMNTAGRAVIFAGTTVVIALMGMFALGVGLLNGLAVSAAVAVLLVLAASLTLLPALLTFFGPRIGRPGFLARRRAAAAGTEPDTATATAAGVVAADDRSSFWTRWITTIQRRPWAALLASTIFMLALATPVLALRLGNTDAGSDSTSHTTRRAYDLMAKGFGKGYSGPLLIAAKLSHAGDTAALERLANEVRATPGVALVGPTRVSPSGEVATFSAYPTTSAQSASTEQLVKHLRSDVIPQLARGTGMTAHIGGATATQIDFSRVLGERLPYFIGVVVLLSALLLMVVFRSLVIPLQAAVMNLLSIAASLGIVVAVFQWGWFGSLFGIAGGPIAAFLPVMVFAIVFGLSMDYEVFLVSRIHEEWTHGADASSAVREGLIRTGRVITAAAAVMVVVFASFIGGGERVIELFGLALASAVFLDALVIRVLMLPAALQLLGERTWWFPAWLDRLLPRFALEPSDAPPVDAHVPSPAGATHGGSQPVVSPASSPSSSAG
ncbi:MAG TPA: MMPL family transporter [Solirubrobacteraceae bacterium]|nr:MMPL family transporter [Solirubrobacteraceae bacterium]